MDWELITKLMNCFPNSFINQSGEFVAHAETNQYFILKNCETENDVKRKVLEWLSRAAFKTEPFYSAKKNREFQKFMLNGINRFLGTNFTKDDMELIYTYLGNACNHAKTIAFIDNEYDFAKLENELLSN